MQHLQPHSFSSVLTALGHGMQQPNRDPSGDEAASRSSWLQVVSRWHTLQVGSVFCARGASGIEMVTATGAQ